MVPKCFTKSPSNNNKELWQKVGQMFSQFSPSKEIGLI